MLHLSSRNNDSFHQPHPRSLSISNFNRPLSHLSHHLFSTDSPLLPSTIHSLFHCWLKTHLFLKSFSPHTFPIFRLQLCTDLFLDSSLLLLCFLFMFLCNRLSLLSASFSADSKNLLLYCTISIN